MIFSAKRCARKFGNEKGIAAAPKWVMVSSDGPNRGGERCVRLAALMGVGVLFCTSAPRHVLQFHFALTAALRQLPAVFKTSSRLPCFPSAPRPTQINSFICRGRGAALSPCPCIRRQVYLQWTSMSRNPFSVYLQWTSMSCNPFSVHQRRKSKSARGSGKRASRS